MWVLQYHCCSVTQVYFLVRIPKITILCIFFRFYVQCIQTLVMAILVTNMEGAINSEYSGTIAEELPFNWSTLVLLLKCHQGSFSYENL